MKISNNYGNMALEEYIIVEVSKLYGQGLQICKMSVDRTTFETLIMNLGSKCNRTKKGHVKIWVGHPYSYELIIKRAR